MTEMSKFQELIHIFEKLGFDIEASYFSPMVDLEYRGDIPEQSGKGGDKVGVGPKTKYWSESKKVWLPQDLFNSTLKGMGDLNFKPMALESKNALIQELQKLSNSKINYEKVVDKLSEHYSEFLGALKEESKSKNFKDLKNVKTRIDKIKKQLEEAKNKGQKVIFEEPDGQSKSPKKITVEELEKELSKLEELLDLNNDLEKNIKNEALGFISENKQTLDKNNSVLKDIHKSFGEEISKVLKRLILRSKSKQEIIDLFEEKISVTYVPKYSPDQKSFTEKDRNFLLGLSKKREQSVTKFLQEAEKYFPSKLIKDLKDASEIFGELKGIGEFLEDYELKSVKEKLREYQNLEDTRKKYIKDDGGGTGIMGPVKNISQIVEPVEKFLNKIKNLPIAKSEYEDSFLGYTEELLKIVKKYEGYSKRMPEVEAILVDILSGEDESKSGLMAAWRDAKIQDISKIMSNISEKFSDAFQSAGYEVSKKELAKNPKLFYENLEKGNQPFWVKDLLKLKNKPVKFEELEIEKSDGSIQFKTELNLKDQEFLKKVIPLFKKKNKEEIEEIINEGLTKEQIKERDKIFKDKTKKDDRKELEKFLSPEDKKKLDILEKSLDSSEKNIKELRQQLKSISKKDVDTIKEKIDKLEKDLTDKNLSQKDADKLIKNIIKLKEDLSKAMSQSDQDKNDIKKKIEETQKDLEIKLNNRNDMKDKLKVFADIDSWSGNIIKEINERNKLKNNDIDLSTLTDSEKKDLIQKFTDVAVVSFLKEFPEITKKREIKEDYFKKIDSLQNKIDEIKNKKDKTKKEDDLVEELEEEIKNLERTSYRIVEKDEKESILAVKEIRKRFQEIFEEEKRKAIQNEDDPNKVYLRFLINEDQFKKFKKEVNELNEKQKEILDKAKIDYNFTTAKLPRTKAEIMSIKKDLSIIKNLLRKDNRLKLEEIEKDFDKIKEKYDKIIEGKQPKENEINEIISEYENFIKKTEKEIDNLIKSEKDNKKNKEQIETFTKNLEEMDLEFINIKKSSSSSNIRYAYENSIYGRIDKVASYTEDELVRQELFKISEKLKEIF
jgi:hypothetical protein